MAQEIPSAGTFPPNLLPDSPRRLLAAAGADTELASFQPREARLWTVRIAGDLLLLRASPVRSGTGSAWAQDIEWLHGYLRLLTESGFVAPRPVEMLAGRSWGLFNEEGFELYSFIEGSIVGWDQVSMSAVGSLLARLHDASAGISYSQRPASYPVAQLSECLATADLSDTPTELRMHIPPLLSELDDDLARIGHAEIPSFVIHGDFTNHNVVANPNPVGAIDFALSYVESYLADLSFGLWRSARPFQEASSLDLSRVSEFVAGYHRVRPLPESVGQALPVYMRARGLQMIVKSILVGRPHAGPLAEVRWIRDHRADIEEAVVLGLVAPPRDGS